MYLEEIRVKVRHCGMEGLDQVEQYDYQLLHLKPFGLIQNLSDIFRRELLAERMLAKENI